MTSSPFYRQSEIVNPQIAISVDLFLAVYLCAPPALFLCVCSVNVCIQGKKKNVKLLKVMNYVTSLSAKAISLSSSDLDLLYFIMLVTWLCPIAYSLRYLFGIFCIPDALHLPCCH